jgi:ubiquinone/menaquinone biosynthesis C-methylase UbiE
MTVNPDRTDTPDPAAIKACCADGYSSDLVALLLGDTYHPGGLALTRRLLDALGVGPGERLLDVAAGTGATALLAAVEYGALVDGVDLSTANVTLASGAAAARGLADRVRFHHGDAESLPLPDQGFDAVLCECALCTFPDKAAAAGELARVLRPGGRVGITDITADHARLPVQLTSLAAWVACVADARPADEYQQLLADQGLHITTVEHHDSALDQTITHIRARLDLLRMTARPRLDALGVDLGRTIPVLNAARCAVLDGVLGYVLIVADKPGPDRPGSRPPEPAGSG